MHLLLVGISHRTAPVELRERLDFQARGLAPALRALRRADATREAVVLSTCNRAEVYVACEDVRPARADISCVLQRVSTGSTPTALQAAHLRPRRSRRGAAPVPRRRRARFAGRRRAADSRPGEGRAHGRDARRRRRAAAQPAVPLLVRRRQARSHGNRPGRGRRLGQLRGGGAGAEDFRRPQGPERPGGRRRRDGQADRAAT